MGFRQSQSRIPAGGDILRIHAFCQFYGYKTNITAFFEIRKYRLVGDINGFVKRLFMRFLQIVKQVFAL
jgi:hypothetical protein